MFLTSRSTVLHIAIALLTSVRVARSSNIRIQFPTTPTSNAITAPADFVGLGFDGAFLNSYDNQFSYNLVNSLTSHMSTPPILRIGGTSMDKFVFDPNQKEPAKCIDSTGCPYGPGTKFSVGPSYFDGFRAFPNSPMTFQAPMGAELNVSGSLDIVTRAYAALGANRTVAIALGNEVNLYHDFTSQDYVNAAHQLQAAIVKALDLTDDGQKIFEVLDLSSPVPDPGAPLSLQGAFANGLNKNGLTILAASHYYQVQSTSTQTLQGNLMNHTAIVHKLFSYKDELSYLQANNPHVPLALTETGSVLGTTSYAGVFGAALWAVDFKLHSLNLEIARVAGTQRPQSAHALWVPISGVTDSPGPQVRGPYYAEIFVADFIGSTGVTTRVLEMDLNSDYYSAYAAYDDAKLTRIAILNFHEWNQGDGSRADTVFNIKLPSGITDVLAGRLTAEAGALAGGYDADGRNITYEGVQWSYKLSNGQAYGKPVLEGVPVANGVATLRVPESQAVLLHLS